MNFFSGITLTAVLLLSVFSLNKTNAQIVKNYQAAVYENENGVLPYRYYQPQQKIMELKRLPLVIFLHGAGERGNDNEKQLTHVAEIFTDPETQEQFPAYVIAPQCAENHRWVEVDWNLTEHDMPRNISKYAGLTMDLVDWMIEGLPIDTNRIYITGLSMGGYATWDLIARFPDKFAAAVPVCGGGDVKQASKISHIPIWAFHGAKDKVVVPERSRSMVKAIKAAGGNPKYTEYPKLGHFSWDAAYGETELLPWLFSQSKNNR